MTKIIKDEGYVDLDREPITLLDGTRLDNALAEKWSREAEVRVGRPSLESTRTPGRSRARSFRLGRSLDSRLEARAEAEGKSPSELVRELLEEAL